LRRSAPEHWLGWYVAACACRDQHRHAEADAILSAAPPEILFLPPVMSVWASLPRGRDPTEAMRRAKQMIGRHPRERKSYIHALYACREEYRGEGDHYIGLLHDRFPRTPDIAQAEADFLMANDDFAAAASVWAECRLRFPEQPAAYFDGAASLRHLGRYDEAEEILLEGQRLFPQVPRMFFEYASVAEWRNDWPTAAERWQNARLRFPDDRACYIGGAVAAVAKTAGVAAAEELVAMGCERFPDDPGVHFEQAYIAQNSGDWVEAVRRWQEILQRWPDDPVALSWLETAKREVSNRAQTG
jgi:tetratricopeptide (TPR) repeat protein